MKTAFNLVRPLSKSSLSVLGLSCLLLGTPNLSYAAAPDNSVPPAPTAQNQAATISQPNAQMASPPGLPMPPFPNKKAPPPPPTPAQLSGSQPATAATEKSDNTLEAAETKGSSSVKSVMHHLDNEVENVTIKDLNSARQAIAKIDILIELEKKMAELDKIRQERETKTMVAALPASALNPATPGMPGMGQNQEQMQANMMMSSGSVDLIRVVGVAGHYRAIIKSGYDTNKTVDVGDAISDGEVVSSISPMSVTFDRRGIKHVVRIKNVDKVFGGSP